MLTASALLWTRVGAGICLLIVANLIYSLWKMPSQVAAGKIRAKTSGKVPTLGKASRTPLVVFLIVFGTVDTILIVHSIAGKVLTSAGGFPLFGLALPLLAIVVGIAAFLQFFMQRAQANASLRWPSTTGKITLADVVMDQRRDDDHDGNRDRTVTVYRPDVRYAYTVGGREFDGSAWKWGWIAFYPDEPSAWKAIAKYATGARVSVFYDPAAPENAILEPGDRSGSWGSVVFGAMFVIGGGLMFWVFATTPGWQ